MKLRGLSTRLAMLMVMATLIMQLGHGLYRFSVDVPKAKQQGMEEMNELVLSLQPAITEALYQYNEALSDKLLKAFAAHDAIQTVWMLDHEQVGAGVWVRPSAEPSGDYYEITWPLIYNDEIIGSLVVLTDMALIEHQAIAQLWNVITFSMLIGLLALLFLYVIAKSMVTKPIEALSNIVTSIDSRAFTAADVKVLDNVHASHEIETLRLSVKSILLKLAKHLSDNQKTLNILQEFNKTLENEVSIRTHELENAKEKAEVANRAKTDFLNVVTHELRTPLNGVLGFSGILKKRNLEEKDKELVVGIEQAGRGLLRLLTDIIDFVGLESKSLNCEIFSVYDALFAAFNDQQALAQDKQLTYSFDVDSSLVLHGDSKRLTVLTRQLLSNGIKFTTTGYVKLSCNIQDDQSILLCVSDTGIGLNEEHYGKLNQEIFTQIEQGLNRSSAGVGLGLAMVNRICTKWPAHMWFEKNVPHGTRVCVALTSMKPTR